MTSARSQAGATMEPINGISAVSLVEIPNNCILGFAALVVGVVFLVYGGSSLDTGVHGSLNHPGFPGDSEELGLSPTPWYEAIDATVVWGRAAVSATTRG